MNKLLEPIFNSPDFPSHVRELQRLLAEEGQRRKRFYEEMTEDGKWEFINGQTVMQSPARSAHCVAVGNLYTILKHHVRSHRLGRVYTEKCLVVFPRNDYEPDVVFFGPEKTKLIDPDTMKFPVPDFVAEVLSPSTEKNDRGVKFRDYEQAGVGEYWIVDPQTATLEQYVLADGRYPLKVPRLGAGHAQSAAVRDFRLFIPDLFLADDESTSP